MEVDTDSDSEFCDRCWEVGEGEDPHCMCKKCAADYLDHFLEYKLERNEKNTSHPHYDKEHSIHGMTYTDTERNIQVQVKAWMSGKHFLNEIHPDVCFPDWYNRDEWIDQDGRTTFAELIRRYHQCLVFMKYPDDYDSDTTLDDNGHPMCECLNDEMCYYTHAPRLVLEERQRIKDINNGSTTPPNQSINQLLT